MALLFAVIASQRVGAKRRPMTGSAKQSIVPHTRMNGLLRRCAPRNDEVAHTTCLPDVDASAIIE
jgi:hypothetical protein